MHTVEKELIKASGYKPIRKFADRQDYLKSILNSVAKLEDDEYNNLTDEAAAWANAAVAAINSKKDDIPDFDEVAPSDEETVSEDDETTDEETVAEDPDEPVEAEADDATLEDDPADDDTEADEPEPETVKPKKSSKKAPAKVAPKVPPKKTEKPTPPRRLSPSERKDAVLDKFGAIEGSKNSQALALFAKGATSKEVKEELGGTYYNILKRAVEAGHRIEKVGSLITLTHKDEIGKKAAPKPAAKKAKK